MHERSFKSAILLMVIILLIAGAVIAAFVLLRSDSVLERVEKNQLINILITVHEDGSVKLIEVLLYNPHNKKGAILFLPNNVWIMLESLGRYDKLEKLYLAGDSIPLRDKIERMIDVKIPYYMDISMQEMGVLTDLLAGIEVFIPSPVNQKKDARMFLFESGSVMLDGEKVKDYLSLELENESDMEKAQRRQDFTKAFVSRLVKNTESGFLSKPEVLSVFKNSVRTNLTSQELETWLSAIQGINLEAMLYRRVHGASRTQNSEKIFIPNDQGAQLVQTMAQAVEFLRNNEELRPEDLIVKLEILNGTDIAFRARDSAKIFRKYGYEVLKEDNAPEKPVKKTVVIEYKGNKKLARDVAAVIKCGNIEEKLDDKATVDITIILGMDFDGQYCQ